MIFDVVYAVGRREIHRATGQWDRAPDDGIQIVTLLEDAGTRVVLSGFDEYWQTPGGVIGARVIDPVPGGLRFIVYVPHPDGHYRVTAEVFAPLNGPPGQTGRPPGNAAVKTGTLIDDDIARQIGIL